MRSLNNRSFFWQWRAIYSASNPNQLKDRWEVDGVLWTRERHTYWGNRYSVQLEVHRLERGRDAAPEWQLLVVIERWWGPDRDKTLRDTAWCKLLSGRADRVRAWLRRQEGSQAPPAASKREESA